MMIRRVWALAFILLHIAAQSLFATHRIEHHCEDHGHHQEDSCVIEKLILNTLTAWDPEKIVLLIQELPVWSPPVFPESFYIPVQTRIHASRAPPENQPV